MPVNFFLDQTDDPLLPDAVPAFDGGQFSNVRANLLQPNQSKLLGNCDVEKLGRLRTRRGTVKIGTGPPSGVADTIIQGLTSYQTKDYNYIVAANNGKIYQWIEGTPGHWTQIARGGVADNEDIIICRTGLINHLVVGPPAENGYPIGTTDLIVDTLSAPVAADTFVAGEKLYFMPNLRTDYYEYTIAGWNSGANTLSLEEPGLVFPVKDNWKFTVTIPAKVNNAAGYAPAATSIAIDGFANIAGGTTAIGAPAVSEKFVIKSENITRTIAAGSTATLLNFTPHLQDDWPGAGGINAPVTFAQGNDLLYFSDGVGPIYAWNGNTSGDPNYYGGLQKIGSHSILDNLAGSFIQSRTNPPTAVSVLLWFQNRLIASGIAAEPDAIYYSDFFDGTSWDQDFQKHRIGGGESDPITGCLAWSNFYMIVFKKNSIYIVNLDPSQNTNPIDSTLLVASYGVTQIHKKIGCPAPRTAVQVGGGSTTPGSDIFFLDGDKKVHSIRRVMAAEQQQEVGQAMSLPIQDVMDLTSLDNISRACATYHNEHYILAIPVNEGLAGGLYPNAVVAYNLLTQSWCGVWSNWIPTCFAMRTDLGSYSKMIFGHSNIFPTGGAGNGLVLQWLDDVSANDETPATYQDYSFPIPTSITTRAFTFGDLYSFKTGLSVEFEFDESVADDVVIKVILDKVVQLDPLADPFPTLSERPLRLGTRDTVLPFVLPASPALLRKAFDIQRYGTWRELQFMIYAPDGKLSIRSIRVTGFMDTIRLQTLPGTGIPALGVPDNPAGGP